MVKGCVWSTKAIMAITMSTKAMISGTRSSSATSKGEAVVIPTVSAWNAVRGGNSNHYRFHEP